MQPGDTITPGSEPTEDKTTANSPPEPPVQPNTVQSQPATAEEPSPWQYSQEEATATSESFPSDAEPVNWTASEFIDHEKNASWFTSLAVITGVAVAVVYLITKDIVTAVVIVIAAILFGVTAKRKPRTLQYQLDYHGVIIGEKAYSYDVFKSFAIMEEGAFSSIQLMPLKRFMPPISLYYPPESEDQIVTTLGSFLPHEERAHDAIERLMRKVRF